jgi:hypothetical protein
VEREQRPDIRLVASFSSEILAIVSARSSAREVWVTDGVAAHIRDHAHEFDVSAAESMLSEVLADPAAVYQGNKATTLIFVEAFDVDHYLVAPVKLLPDEAWLETAYVTSKARFHRRHWVQSGLIFRRKE